MPRPRRRRLVGLFQFTEQTWLATLKEQGTALGYGPYANFISRQPSGDYWVSEPRMSGAVVILRSDPTANSLMAGASTKANAGKLAARLGRDPSEGELYIAHFLGPTGASRLIGLADTSPLTPAATVFPTAARANPTIFYEGGGNTRSASEVYRFLVGRYDVARGGPEKATTVAVNASESAPAQNAFAPGTAGLAETYAAAARGEVGSVLQQPAQAVGGCGHFRISERAGIALDVVGGEDNSWRVCLDRPLLLTLRRARQAGRIRRASMPRSHRRSWPAPPRRGRPGRRCRASPAAAACAAFLCLG